jgi:hypothetical protein
LKSAFRLTGRSNSETSLLVFGAGMWTSMRRKINRTSTQYVAAGTEVNRRIDDKKAALAGKLRSSALIARWLENLMGRQAVLALR